MGGKPKKSLSLYRYTTDMKTLILALLLAAVAPQGDPEINIKAGKVAGNIDPMLYGQLFEHIYFSANDGVWQELIYERSFEPEH